jgi:glucokinase
MTIGLDLGGTTFNAACVDNAGRVLLSREYPTRQNDAPDVLLPRLAAAIQEVLSELSDEQRAQVQSVGVGVPGPVKPSTGVCVYAPNLEGWTNLPVAPTLREKLNLPVFLINDADAAAFGEARFGAGRDCDNLLVLTLGTGIGSGLILGGKLHLGQTERGAEIGHMTVDFDSKRGTAGNIGTLESVCGRDAIVWRALRHLGSGRESNIPKICADLSKLTPRCIATAAAQGDKVAQDVWNETAVYLAVGIVNIFMMVDVGCVVIGGGIAQAGEVLFAPLRRAVAARTSRIFFDSSKIVPAQLGPDAGVIGAAQWARENSGA